MTTCQYCGAQIEGNLKFCENCGAPLPIGAPSEPEAVEATIIEDQPYQQPMYQQPGSQGQSAGPGTLPQSYDSGSIGWAILGFFIPIVGIVLYFVWMRDKPQCAKMSLYGALVSIGLALLFRLGAGCAFVF